jgi:hypothetical protein
MRRQLQTYPLLSPPGHTPGDSKHTRLCPDKAPDTAAHSAAMQRLTSHDCSYDHAHRRLRDVSRSGHARMTTLPATHPTCWLLASERSQLVQTHHKCSSRINAHAESLHRSGRTALSCCGILHMGRNVPFDCSVAQQPWTRQHPSPTSLLPT